MALLFLKAVAKLTSKPNVSLSQIVYLLQSSRAKQYNIVPYIEDT